jgi:hypothetical protein
MENASHSDEFWGYEFAQPVGTAVRWGHNCSGREQKSESVLHYLVKAFWPSAHWWSLK